MKYSQENLSMRIDAQLGDPDTVLLSSFRGTEAMSRLYDFKLDLLSQSKTLKFDDLLGKRATVELHIAPRRVRRFHGILTKVARGPRDHDFTHFQAVLRPEIWTRSQNRAFSIFQDKTVVQILQELFEGQFIDVDKYLRKEEFQPHKYRVQYHESDVNFASRLMEEEGICYFFEHRAKREFMVLANAPTAMMHPLLPDESDLVFDEEHTARFEGPRISGWHRDQKLVNKIEFLDDHHFQFPSPGHLSSDAFIRESVSLNGGEWKLQVPANEAMSALDFPGGYAKRFDEIRPPGNIDSDALDKVRPEGDRLSRIIMEREACHSVVLSGTSDYAHLAPGHRFQLTGHFQDSEAYLLTQVDHYCSQSLGRAGVSSTGLKYNNQFACVPARMPYRPFDPSLCQPHARPQTAMVIGPKNQEIFTDRYGRVKVLFCWDAPDEQGVTLSCWLRVAQLWAGNGWGHLWIPRIGHEVLVDFLEGDPDQPIIVGSVYNKSNPPPYLGENDDATTASGKATQNGIKSRSTPGGGPENFNEIRFEDKKDHEVLGIHAERDLQTSVERNESHSVGVDQTITVGSHRFIKVGGVTEKGEEQGEERTLIFKDHHHVVLNDTCQAVAGKLDASVLGNAVENYSASLKIKVDQDLMIRAKTISLHADTKITLSVGGDQATSYIVIDGQKGITIVGAPSINLNPPGGAAPSAPAIPKAATPKTPS